MNKLRHYMTKRRLREFCEDTTLNLQRAKKEIEHFQTEIIGLERRNAELESENEKLKNENNILREKLASMNPKFGVINLKAKERGA